MTRLILRKDVDNLGHVGDVVDVKPGYARNYLIPQGFAYSASESSARRLQQERQQAVLGVERERENRYHHCPEVK